MVKCRACGKLIPTKALNDSVRCTNCPASYHRICVPATDTAPGTEWLCSGCRSIPTQSREEVFSTPVKLSAGSNNTQLVPTAADVIDRTLEVRSEESTLLHELKSIKKEMSAMRSEVRQCRAEIADFKSSIATCLEQVANVESRVSALEQKLENSSPTCLEPLEATISQLQKDLNDRDQQLLLNDLLVAGLPEEKNENLTHSITLIATKLGVQLQETDIVHIERVGPVRRNYVESGQASTSTAADPPTLRPRDIAIRMARRSTRDNLLRAARVRRVLATTDIDVPGSQRRIYLNERLTRANHQLFRRAREAGRRAQWKYVWSRQGHVFIKKNDSARTYRIYNDGDVDKFFGH